MKRGLRLAVVNQKKRGTASSAEQKSASSSMANKKRAIYIVLHVSTIQIGELVGKASAPVKVCPISLLVQEPGESHQVTNYTVKLYSNWNLFGTNSVK